MQQNQVVITLTLEQFARLQQLANMAGAKSVNAFAKEKLLAILGANTILTVNITETKKSSLQPLVSELKRMHTELQELVTESLEKKVQIAPSKELDSLTANTSNITNDSRSKNVDPPSQKQPFLFLDNLSANQNSSGLHDPLQELLKLADPLDTPKPAEENKKISKQEALLKIKEDFLADLANLEFEEDEDFDIPPVTKKEQAQLDALNTIDENLTQEDKSTKKSRQNIYQPTISNTPDTIPDSQDNSSSLSNKQSSTSNRKDSTSSKRPKDPSTNNPPSTSKGPPPRRKK